MPLSSEWWVMITLMMEAVSSFETLVNIYQTMCWNIPEDSNHHMSLRESESSQYSTIKGYLTNAKPYLYSMKEKHWQTGTQSEQLYKKVCIAGIDMVPDTLKSIWSTISPTIVWNHTVCSSSIRRRWRRSGSSSGR